MSYYSIATRERKCRRYLDEVGLKLHKCRVRDEGADTYGLYAIVNPKRDTTPYQFEFELDEVEAYIHNEVEPELLARRRYGF